MKHLWDWWQRIPKDLIYYVIYPLIAAAIAGLAKLSTTAIRRRLRKRSKRSSATAARPIPLMIKVEGSQPLQARIAPPETQPANRHLPSIPRPPVLGFVARHDKEGRDILACLEDELAPHKGSLVNLWGPGGVGKTALAAEVARRLQDVFQRRVVWTGPELRDSFTFTTFLDEVASQLGHGGLRQLADDAKREKLHAIIAEHNALIILDNFETVPAEEQQPCVHWLAQELPCPALITSRSGVEAARNFQIDAMTPAESVEFVDRAIAQRANPQIFAGLDRQQIIQVAEQNPLLMDWIVRQIDLAQESQQVLSDLRGGNTGAAERIFDRSFHLPRVGEDGRAVLIALALFLPGASREALADVAGFSIARPWQQLSQQERMDFVSELVSRKRDWLRVPYAVLRARRKTQSPGDDPQARLSKALKPLADLHLIKPLDGGKRIVVEGLTRELAKAHLEKRSDAAAFRGRYIRHFLRYAKAHTRMSGEDYDTLESERENIIAALNLAYESEDWNSVMGICGDLTSFLGVRGFWTDALQTGEKALQAARNAKNEVEISWFAHNLGVLREWRADREQARHLFQESLAIEQKISAERPATASLQQAEAKLRRWKLAWLIPWVQLIYRLMLEAEKARADQSRRRFVKGLFHLGDLAREEGDSDEAQRLYQESLELAKSLDFAEGVGLATHGLAHVFLGKGDLDRAWQLNQEALAIGRQLENPDYINKSLAHLAEIARKQGRQEEARRLYQESLDGSRKFGDRVQTIYILLELVVLEESTGNASEAQRIFAEAQELYRALDPAKAEGLRPILEKMRAAQA